MNHTTYTLPDTDVAPGILCEPIADYCHVTRRAIEQSLFPQARVETVSDDIRVLELFAGVGGFRIGLERASKRYKTVWNNQWEPSTKKQDASLVYRRAFGEAGHSNEDIALVPTEEIPEADMLVGGFPCQDYSVATSLKNAHGIEGKKGVLWWQIHRILRDMAVKPKYLMLENVDRILKSPAKQRGRDFALILASLSDLGYCVEWRVINAADYGMPQRRRRTYIVAYRQDTPLGMKCSATDKFEWLLKDSVEAKAFPCEEKAKKTRSYFSLNGSLVEISDGFNIKASNKNFSPFGNAGIMVDRQVFSTDIVPVYNGEKITLGDILVNESYVSQEYYVNADELEKWKYLKGGKKEKRTTKEGFEYNYSEGPMAFPDSVSLPSRTIITGEGGKAPSRFKHVVLTPSGRYRRLLPVELERLNMFPDNHTLGVSDIRRAFLMGNALVTGIVERIGVVLLGEIG